MNIYQTLTKPIISLSPMEDVTDTVFRRLVSSIQRPDLFYTEFVNVEGLTSEGRDSVIHRLKYDKTERSIIAQLWGITPSKFEEATKIVVDMGFEGIDINMGCSVNKISVTGAGSALINTPTLAGKIIESVKKGSLSLPVSVKTRLGWEEYDINNWIGFLLDYDLDVLTVHGRTARGLGAVKANWEEIKRCVELRDEKKKKTLIFGNGDIQSVSQAKDYAERYCVDGVMIGRAAISNPWIFSERENVTKAERIDMFKKHIELFEETWGDNKNFHSLKKFFRAYVNNFDGAAEIRSELMNSNSVTELKKNIDRLLS